MGQKTLATVNMKRRCLVVEWTPRYWAVGLAFGRNYHVQVGPVGLSLFKRQF
ncbi:hypothetical protein [Alicyclobacillus sp. SO9]|uniref:hypothetical protein n=1 Tax=Alicyclobacillus sp. SO9 TaxID=2665646 RepID=UPI0018E8792D|nr:hypothetical protein [Alicyclobacillus sp. SO9]QQE78293.1 hypothetical protein GI364_20820 [Alicyclobacillus sp. SO9]